MQPKKSDLKKLKAKKKKEMKRIGKTSNIINEIVELGNLNNSIDVVLRGTKRKATTNGKRILANRQAIMDKLADEIKNGTFGLSGYTEMLVTDGPKIRKVQSVSLYERIGVNAIMNIVEAHIFRKYIRTTNASIKNRGLHDLLNYIRKDLKEHPSEMKYSYKFDVKKFYESINQDFMMYSLRRIFKDKILLTILERFVRMMPQGLSIGLRSSQSFGNILLSMFLDHYLKDNLGHKYFYRYCDDGDDNFATKKECWEARNIIHERAEFMMLKIKENERVSPISEGIDYLGYVIRPTHTRLRKRNKKKAAKKLHEVKSKNRRTELIASFYGLCKHANCRNLFYKITGITMKEYKRMKDLGIKAKYDDNKKRFDCTEVNISQLVKEEILILDFETGVITKPQVDDYNKRVDEASRQLAAYQQRGEPIPASFILPGDIKKPIGKYLVHIKREDGSEAKFFTGDKENYSKLDQAKEMGEIPCYSTVKIVRGREYNRYILE